MCNLSSLAMFSKQLGGFQSSSIMALRRYLPIAGEHDLGVGTLASGGPYKACHSCSTGPTPSHEETGDIRRVIDTLDGDLGVGKLILESVKERWACNRTHIPCLGRPSGKYYRHFGAGTVDEIVSGGATLAAFYRDGRSSPESKCHNGQLKNTGRRDHDD